MSLLEVNGLAVARGGVEAVHDVSLAVGEGEVVTLLGANGAGKTTTLLAICGALRARRGTVRFGGAEITRAGAHRNARSGLVLVPEGREILTRMTVRENLLLGGWSRRDSDGVPADIDTLLERFPALAARRDAPASVLSGGEQQMLAIARGLVARPRLLLLDEPSLGLSPRMVDEVFDIVAEIGRAGTSMLLVEQNAERALECSLRAYVMERGRITLSGQAAELAEDERVRQAYLT